MCGIAAVLNGSIGEVEKMGAAISHRGLTASIAQIGHLKVYFTHLPITDKLAPLQPYKAGKYTVWLNGYISNYKELAEKYDIKLETNCDTELLTKFFDLFDDTKVNELNGFFAVLMWIDGRIVYFTDRYGIKQLYRYSKGKTTYVCSEIKGILAVADLELNQQAVEDWHYSLGVMTENTIYKGVEKALCLPMPLIKKIKISYHDAKEQLKKLFLKAIARNKGENDCVFLSGGIDSGIIAKFIKPDYCFSVDYVEKKYSEIENIKLNSTSKHHTIICNEDLFNSYKEKTASILDDPKAGSSYTNVALTELASKFCTIVYSGAGGDEFFGGYPHRINKPINEVIKRTSAKGKTYDISHNDYDRLFLKAVLIVEDRIGGHYTMETRYPLLDNDLVNFTLSLPDKYLKNKRILKDISGLNETVINSDKKGFSNPYCTNEQWTNLVLNVPK